MDIGLQIRNLNTAIPFPEYKKPKPVGFFSVNTERDWDPTDEQLRYYKMPKKFPLDLNVSLNKAIKRPDNTHDEGLRNLLKFMFHHYNNIFSNNPTGPPEFVTWRGVLRLIMSTPYEYRDDWCIHVTYFNNTFYMREWELPQKLYNRQNQTELQKAMCAWGYKFEQYCLWKTPFSEPDPKQPADECAEFLCVFRTRLGGLNLLFGAEIDGILSDEPIELNYYEPNLENVHFVEVKVRLGALNSHQKESFLRYKTRNWWCQTFLAGINDLFIGLRNNEGFVQTIEHMEMKLLPKMDGQNYWAPSVCMNFLLSFLLCLKKIIGYRNCPHTVHEFHFNAKMGRIYYKCWPTVSAYTFLPDWYLNLIYRNTHNQQQQ